MNILTFNAPFFSIFIPLVAGILTVLVKKGSTARKISYFAVCTAGFLSLAVIFGTLPGNISFTYMVGHHPAPWGNELRAGVFEGILAFLFSAVMLLSLTGAKEEIEEDILPYKVKFYYLLMNLLFASLLALIYTNDIFTGYVFIEINTVAACAIVMAKEKGDTLLATIHYLFMSLLGSGLFLFGICILYGITGHLLMPNLLESVGAIYSSGNYAYPLLLSALFMTIGLSIKSALFPFSAWLPGAHGSATSGSSAVLSGLVLKGYIVLLIKIFYRVYGINVVNSLGITNIILVLGILGMIIGSVFALRQTDIKYMIAYSTVAQIGYIFMGLGLGTPAGLIAAVYHIFTHAICKSCLFLAAGNIIHRTGNRDLRKMGGIGFELPVTMTIFSIGALSMIGIPMFMGFNSKWNFAMAILEVQNVPAIIALTLSTLLNAIYYLPIIIRAFFGTEASIKYEAKLPSKEGSIKSLIPLLILAGLVIGFGVYSKGLLGLISLGLEHIY